MGPEESAIPRSRTVDLDALFNHMTAPPTPKGRKSPKEFVDAKLPKAAAVSATLSEKEKELAVLDEYLAKTDLPLPVLQSVQKNRDEVAKFIGQNKPPKTSNSTRDKNTLSKLRLDLVLELEEKRRR